MRQAIQGVGLTKTFVKKRSIRQLVTHPFRRAERVRALCGVDLEVREGEIFGLLGPNGAGKTTLLKIFSCLVLPDEGRAVVGGHDTLDENEVKRRIGLVHSDERSFYWRLSGRENLRFFARLYDVPRRSCEARICELLERVEMTEAADRPFSDYSSGMKQRMAIARALLHDPPILLMDEPTKSLDPASSLALREFVGQTLRGKLGKTVLLATHNLREAETLADRIAILIRGRVRHVGTVDELRRRGAEERTFLIELHTDPIDLQGPFRIVDDQQVDGRRRLKVRLDPEARLDDLLRVLLSRGARVESCDRDEPDLEQAFSRLLRSDEEGAS